MKKVLAIFTLISVLCIHANAEIITLRNCEKTYDSVNGYQVSGSFMTFTIDTEKKQINLKDDGSYGGVNINFKIKSGSIDDGFVSERFTIDNDPSEKWWLDEVILYPKNSSATYIEWGKKFFKKESVKVRHWKVRCEHSSYKEIAKSPKNKKPKKEKPIASPDDNKIVPAGSGSGFFVLKDGTVITNYHVIEGCELNKVSYKGSQSEAKVLSIDKVNDIAILKTNINPQTAFSVSNEDVSLLEDVVVAGYPLGKQISSAIKTHKGVVTALAGAGDNYSYFQTDAAINQGNSGGPIINQKGNVVGIAVQTWVEEGVQGVHFGIKSSTLKTFASANGLKFLAPNNKDLSNKELGKLITESTVYVECHMTIAKIKKMLAEAENKKALFKEYK